MRIAYPFNQFSLTTSMPLAARLAVLFALAATLHVPLAIAQRNLGEMLDAGAQRVSVEEFRRDLVGRPISGPGAAATHLEIVYLDDGRILGVGSNTAMSGKGAPNAQHAVQGSWSTDHSDRICASLVISGITLPPRCQYWYKRGEQYFLSDSDSDRSMRVFPRAVMR